MNAIHLKSNVLLMLLICMSSISYAQNNTDYRLHTDISYYSKIENPYQDSICKLDVYVPVQKKGFATVIWFHGGGLSGGTKDLPAALREKGFAVVSVGYRLTPRVKAEECIDDAAAAIAWVFKNISAYGGDSSRIVLSGHSAGGYLAMMCGMDASHLKPYGISNNAIAAMYPLSGQCITHFAIRKERDIPALQPQIDTLAPLFHVKPGLPLLILVTGDREKELFGRYEENAYLWRMMQLNGNTGTELMELDGFNHGGMVKPGCMLLADYMQRFK